jgi:hypothetical protein
MTFDVGANSRSFTKKRDKTLQTERKSYGKSYLGIGRKLGA